MSKDKKLTLDMGLIIRQKLDERGTTIAWLAKKIGCDRSNLYTQLHRNAYIDTQRLEQISIALKFDFFVYHSNYVNIHISDNKQHSEP